MPPSHPGKQAIYDVIGSNYGDISATVPCKNNTYRDQSNVSLFLALNSSFFHLIV
jgi:hypothetical protein